MRKIINWVKDNPNRSMFLLPIILVAGISISHVVSWYDITNPFSWAVYLSVAIEIGAMTALVAATNKMKGGVWFMFGLITLIQMIGNIFFSFKEIDANGSLFKSWVELTGPLWDMIGSDSTDVVSMKRWLAFLEGGLLPIISLTSLHFFVKYEKSNSPKKEEISPNEEVITVNQVQIEETNSPKEDENLFQEEVYLPTKEEALIEINETLNKEVKKVWAKVEELREESKLPETTEEDDSSEPTTLANSEYRLEEINEEDDEQPLLVEEENPEDEIIIPMTGDTRVVEVGTDIKAGKTLGDELTKSWNRIIKKNNTIDRLG
jgi:hypothetical protein